MEDHHVPIGEGAAIRPGLPLQAADPLGRQPGFRLGVLQLLRKRLWVQAGLLVLGEALGLHQVQFPIGGQSGPALVQGGFGAILDAAGFPAHHPGKQAVYRLDDPVPRAEVGLQVDGLAPLAFTEGGLLG